MSPAKTLDESSGMDAVTSFPIHDPELAPDESAIKTELNPNSYLNHRSSMIKATGTKKLYSRRQQNKDLLVVATSSIRRRLD